jgi:hypothetical protein
MIQEIEKILKLLEISSNKKCIGDQKLTVGSASAVGLTIPTGALLAIITVEADATSTDTTRAVRFRESGSAATASIGTPLGDLDTYECIGPDPLSLFSVIGIEGSKSHTLNINYYR